MAPTQRPDVSVLEYDRLESAIEARIRQRQRELSIDEIATAADVSEAKALSAHTARGTRRGMRACRSFLAAIGDSFVLNSGLDALGTVLNTGRDLYSS